MLWMIIKNTFNSLYVYTHSDSDQYNNKQVNMYYRLSQSVLVTISSTFNQLQLLCDLHVINASEMGCSP